jgi:glucoamylase
MIGTPPAPGIPPTWTSSAKDMVGCALGSSRLWFTLGFGIVNEVYYPRVDIPQIRDLGLIVADGEGFWAEVKRVADYQLRQPSRSQSPPHGQLATSCAPR